MNHYKVSFLTVVFCLWFVSFNEVHANNIAPNQNNNWSLLTSLRPMDLVQGSFLQKKYFKILKQPIKSSGLIFIDKQAGFVWQTRKPASSILILNKQGLYSGSTFDTKFTHVKGASDFSQILMDAITGNVAALTLSFSAQRTNDLNCLKLIPINSQISTLFSSLRLCTKQQKIDQLTLIETTGNRTEIVFQLNEVNNLPKAIRAKL